MYARPPIMRALVVTNMYPTPARPALGSFVRDQVEALRRIDGIEVTVFAFDPGGTAAYLKAAKDLRTTHRGNRFDVVHAHFGLTAWPAFAASGRTHAVTLHGTDLTHPRSRKITLGALPFVDLVATVSEPLAQQLPRWAARKRQAILPAGVATDRFKPNPRAEARTQLGLEPNRPYLLFPADPNRPEKRYDRAAALAKRHNVRLLTLGNTDPQEVPLWVNSANAVLVPSERESYGLAVLEALACDVPILATPVGIAPEALNQIPGTYCGPFDESAWSEALQPHLQAQDPRIQGRKKAERYSTDRMAANVVTAWRALTERS
jgi:glycosyltransferase involved in cell wall biosynthesis